ncbi:MAG: ABC transporter permease [Candidatus Eremiobacteraeota bacterium]|nr:ABC transporter permease [Candidatus Eremiobacteraeota bacterium]
MTRVVAYLGEAVASLWRNKVRSALTMLGMIIGTSSIIAVFGLSKAATSGIEGTLNSFGTFPITAQVDATQDYPDRAQIRYSDAARLAADLGDRVHEVQPSWTRTWKVTYGTTSDYYEVGTTGVFQDDSLQMSEGRKIDAQDVQSAARVVAISQTVADKFFPNGGAVGHVLTMNANRYLIVGVYAPIKSPLLTSLGGSDFIAVPYSTFYRAVNLPPDNLSIYPMPGVDVDVLRSQITASLRHVHGPQAQYEIIDGAGALKTFDNVLNIAGAGLAAIGTVALVVAGIGIMNIMLVTVTERTREIGLRKSIGASRADIMLQFLMESIVLATLGGGTGMAFGLLFTIGGAELLSKQLGDLIIPYVLVVSIALSFSIAVGMIFGIYPAFRAATMDPIEALRS